MIIPEAEERTVRIPVQWIDGHWQLIGGGELPELTKNACADLMLPAVFLADDEQRQRWTREIEVKFLKADTKLFARVSMNNVPDALRNQAEEKKHDLGASSLFVCIILQEDVSIALTLGKKGKLVGGECRIPGLGEKAKSINEAYTKIIRSFDPKRRSDTGNVFSVVFIELNGRMVKLDVLRNRVTDAAAIESARPRERSEKWSELATKLSRVHDVWSTGSKAVERWRFSKFPSRGLAPIPYPDNSTDEVVNAGQEYYDFRYRLMTWNDLGLAEIDTQLHDPDDISENILKLRELRQLMDRAVLNAYGWADLAQTARCEFLPDSEENEESADTNTKSNKNKPLRLRWPDDFRDEVLARLLELNEQRHKEERLAGLAATENETKTKLETKRVRRSQDTDSIQSELF